MKRIAFISICAMAFFCGLKLRSIAQITPISVAEACRDCPFPLRIDEYRWRMPNGKIEFELVEADSHDGTSLVYVTLYDRNTTKVIATGSQIIYTGETDFGVTLYDADGNSINSEFTWADRDLGRLQAGFSCKACRIKPILNEIR